MPPARAPLSGCDGRDTLGLSGIAGIVETGFSCHPFGHIALQLYESNLELILRFMVDTKLAGAGWVELPAGSYTVRAPELQTSHCQLEVDIPCGRRTRPRLVCGCWSTDWLILSLGGARRDGRSARLRWKRLVALSIDGEWSRIAPLRTLSFGARKAARV